MTPTSQMLQKYLDGYEIVVLRAPTYPGRKDGRWPVLYQPRWERDWYPFVPVGEIAGEWGPGWGVEAIPTAIPTALAVEWDPVRPQRFSGWGVEAIPTAAQIHVCESCGMNKPDVERIPDPFDDDVYNTIVLRNLCGSCAQDRADEI